ncbi:shikimate dehydrogenase family protein [Microterricola pindariensis]|uniref:shikimate dehydrogenase (NADP(+)) n=1 Tax=Microterricola pindariensis TaxID=478010 RepID=A0ABX5B0A4_9MICO|nr:shikimate dehydrogenase [Microterricola pindariensis]PPL20225.1 hypothetical protein GY24_01380 [Microterricola pindariensis]
MRITGSTAVLFILCDPVSHVKGTDILNRQLLEEGIDAAFSPLHVAPGSLGTVIAAIRDMKNVAGFGVTIPHKIEVLPHLDEITTQAREAGSVNFVRRSPEGKLIGTNIDGAGFTRGFSNQGMTLKGRKVLQLGAGGAGRAIAFAIAAAGAAQLTIWNRSSERAVALAAEVARAYPLCLTVAGGNDPAGFGVVVNTTSAGMSESVEMVIDPSRLSRGTLIAEIVINPTRTTLLRCAEEKGLNWSNGTHMLEAQYELMRDFIGLRK